MNRLIPFFNPPPNSNILISIVQLEYHISICDHIHYGVLAFTMASAMIHLFSQIPDLLRDFVPTFHGVAADKQHG